MRTRKLRRGQGMTENIITVALVAIAAIGIITLYGDNVRSLFGNSSDALAGDEVRNVGGKSDNGLTKKDMKNFAISGGSGSGGTPGTNSANGR